MCIVRVTKAEYELSNGRIFPIIPPLKEEMSIEEFQKHYDYAVEVVNSFRDVGCDNSNSEKLE
jgi:hypothetical protein